MLHSRRRWYSLCAFLWKTIVLGFYCWPFRSSGDWSPESHSGGPARAQVRHDSEVQQYIVELCDDELRVPLNVGTFFSSRTSGCISSVQFGSLYPIAGRQTVCLYAQTVCLWDARVLTSRACIQHRHQTGGKRNSFYRRHVATYILQEKCPVTNRIFLHDPLRYVTSGL
jgi:hypothetical protein